MSTYESIQRLAALTEPTRNALQTLESEWQPDLPPNTVALGTVARALAAGMEKTPRDQIHKLLDFVEKLLTTADSNTKDAVATGFLESLLGEASAGRFDFTLIESLLGDASRNYWHAWDTFTGLRTKGLSKSPISQTAAR
jgi:hypothetical protein